MAVRPIGIIMNVVTGRMGLNQHLVRSILAIRDQGGVGLPNGDRVMPDPILVGRNAGKIAALGKQYGIARTTTDLAASLKNPDDTIFFDAATTQMRPKLLEKAIAAGKHIYCEKPIATTLEEALAPDPVIDRLQNDIARAGQDYELNHARLEAEIQRLKDEIQAANRRVELLNQEVLQREEEATRLKVKLEALEAKQLYALIAELPEPFRDALVAIDLLGLSYREAARTLRVREATVARVTPRMLQRTVLRVIWSF